MIIFYCFIFPSSEMEWIIFLKRWWFKDS